MRLLTAIALLIAVLLIASAHADCPCTAPPSGCGLTPSPAQAGAGGAITLTAFCSAGTLPIDFLLSGGSYLNLQARSGRQTSATVGVPFSGTMSGPAMIGGTATNSVGSAALATSSVSMQPPPADLCATYGPQVVGPLVVPWGQAYSKTQIFGDNTIWLFQMTVPAGATQKSAIGFFNVVEVASPTIRQMTISESACDFRTRDYTGATGPLIGSQGVSTTINYNTLPPSQFGGVAGLTPGKTYYVSVRDFQSDPPPGSWSCPAANCNALMNAQPQGAQAAKKRRRSRSKGSCETSRTSR